MSTRKTHRRLKALGGALLAFAMLAALYTPAFAAYTPITKGIVIHKYQVDSLAGFTTPGDGLELAPGAAVGSTTLDQLKPLENVSFEVYSVTLQAGKQEGSTNIDDYDKTLVNTIKTDADGEVSLTLGDGLYYVQELPFSGVSPPRPACLCANPHDPPKW